MYRKFGMISYTIKNSPTLIIRREAFLYKPYFAMLCRISGNFLFQFLTVLSIYLQLNYIVNTKVHDA